MMKALLTTLAVFPIASSHGALIQLNFDNNTSPAHQQVFQAAANFWNSTIVGYDLIYDSLGQILPHSLTIDVSIPAIDGVGGILGQAGWDTATYYDNNPVGPPTLALYYATTGIMQFDAADVSALMSAGLFYGVVLHEMAHVLGLGTLWTFNHDLAGPGTYPLYTTGSGEYYGPAALAAWQTEFNQPGATFVPIELGGGPGTANGHWNELDGGALPTGIVSNLTGMDFAFELMTGWASGQFYLSTVTLGGLDDLGYIVDYSKAGVVPIPEPASALLVVAGIGCFARRRRR